MSMKAQDVQITFDKFNVQSVPKTSGSFIINNYDFANELKDYLRNLNVRNFSKNTIKVYTSIISKFLRSLKYACVKDEKKHFVDFFERYIERINGSVSYKYLVVTTLKSFLFKCGITYLDDFGNVKKPKSIPHPLSEEEIHLMMETLHYDKRVDPVNVVQIKMRNKLIIRLFYATGIRVSELCKIKVSDVDLLNYQIHIWGKGSKERIVIFDKITANELKKYLDERNIESEYLFASNRGKNPYLSSRQVQKIIKQCGKDAGLKKKVTPHSLRHSFATNLLKKGMSMRYIQDLMGHENISTTQIYIQTELSDIQHEYHKLK